MTNRDVEAALAAALAHVTEADDPAIADRAIELYLSSFGTDQAARLLAVRRLTGALLARDDLAWAAEDLPALVEALKRRL